jgi:uncharacterized protein (TIGR02186 family)
MSALRLALLAALMLTALLPGARGALAEPLVAELSSHLIGITGSFTGASVVLFGATDGGGDVVVVVRGPERDMVVRRKRRVAGIWVNAKEEEFAAVPSYYSVAASRPLEAIATPSVLSLNQLGLDNLHIARTRGPMRQEDVPFRTALIEQQQREKLFGNATGKVEFLGDRLFRSNLDFPSNVPTGTYIVQVFLLRNKAVVAGQTVPLFISKIGVDAEVYNLADRRATIYGVVAVVTAIVAGWLASLPFRNA